MPQVTDPVCGMTVDSETAIAREPHGDHVHYFCSTECAAAFRQAPDRYTVDEALHGAAGHTDPDAERMRRRTPPRMMEDGIATPMFGSAGSGGAEFEPIPEEDEEPER